MIILYARQKKRHRCTQQTFGLYGRRWGWDDLREHHRNMYIIKFETDRQSRLDAWDKCLGLVHWDDPEGWDGEGGGRGDSRWGTHVNLWLIHVSVWQKPLQYCKVISLQLIEINEKKINLVHKVYVVLFCLSVGGTCEGLNLEIIWEGWWWGDSSKIEKWCMYIYFTVLFQ